MRHYSHIDNKKIFLDTKLDKLFKHKKNGFYIELGANNGLTQSNSAFFERDIYYYLQRRNRPRKRHLCKGCEHNVFNRALYVYCHMHQDCRHYSRVSTPCHTWCNCTVICQEFVPHDCYFVRHCGYFHCVRPYHFL